MDPPQPVPGAGDYSMVEDLTPEAIDALVAAAGPDSGSPLLSVELRPLRGALSRPQASHGARGTFDAGYTLFAVGMAMSPEMKAAVVGHAGRVVEALSPYRASEGYINFAERATDPADLFGDQDTYGRLRAVKTGYDEDDLFRSNHPVPPAR
jgi:hypothetical protein